MSEKKKKNIFTSVKSEKELLRIIEHNNFVQTRACIKEAPSPALTLEVYNKVKKNGELVNSMLGNTNTPPEVMEVMLHELLTRSFKPMASMTPSIIVMSLHEVYNRAGELTEASQEELLKITLGSFRNKNHRYASTNTSHISDISREILLKTPNVSSELLVKIVRRGAQRNWGASLHAVLEHPNVNDAVKVALIEELPGSTMLHKNIVTAAAPNISRGIRDAIVTHSNPLIISMVIEHAENAQEWFFTASRIFEVSTAVPFTEWLERGLERWGSFYSEHEVASLLQKAPRNARRIIIGSLGSPTSSPPAPVRLSPPQ